MEENPIIMMIQGRANVESNEGSGEEREVNDSILYSIDIAQRFVNNRTIVYELIQYYLWYVFNIFVSNIFSSFSNSVSVAGNIPTI